VTADPWITLAERLGSFGLLAYIIVYGLRVALPNAASTISEGQQKVARALDTQSKMLAKLAALVLEHNDVKGASNDS